MYTVRYHRITVKMNVRALVVGYVSTEEESVAM